MAVIDLDGVAGNGQVRNLSGKARGEDVRRALKIEGFDNAKEPVTVLVPSYLHAISSSFFLGLFSPSVKLFGGSERFLEHYKFEADSNIMKQIMHGIDRCLLERNIFNA